MTEPAARQVTEQRFFTTLGTTHRQALGAHGVPVSYRHDEVVFTEGGVADRFWLLEQGTVALTLRVPGRGEQIIETLGGGTVLGWSWWQPPYRWQFGAVAREPVSAVAFDATAVRQLCDADPAFGYAMLRLFIPVITERLQATRLRLLDLYATPAQAGRP